MNINFSKTSFAQRKIPRNLYHLTSKKNYLSMLKDGIIKTSHDADPTTNLNGVFLFDMKNFIKRWTSTGIKIDYLKNPLTLAKALILNAAMKNTEIVLLKIPTKNLFINQLLCRVQSFGLEVPLEHQNNGDLAINQKHYTRKKFPIEYIYQSEIPIDKVEKIGEFDSNIEFNKPLDITIYEQIDQLDLFSKILGNQPEQKCVELAKKSSFKIKEI